MQHQVIILIGPPGAGKGTQAELLADDFGFYHFETSKIIEVKMQTNEQAKADYAVGKLVDPKLVTSWVIDTIREIGATQSMVFSGSFRTMHEAKIETPVVEELFGKENVHIINIQVGEEESVKRNVSRRICTANRHPIPNFPEFEGMTVCPKDGSELVKRSLDNDETMRVRYKTYIDETTPVLDYFRNRAYTIIEVNGEQPIRNVHNDIIASLHALAHPDLEKKLNDSIGATT